MRLKVQKLVGEIEDLYYASPIFCLFFGKYPVWLNKYVSVVRLKRQLLKLIVISTKLLLEIDALYFTRRFD